MGQHRHLFLLYMHLPPLPPPTIPTCHPSIFHSLSPSLTHSLMLLDLTTRLSLVLVWGSIATSFSVMGALVGVCWWRALQVWLTIHSLPPTDTTLYSSLNTLITHPPSVVTPRCLDMPLCSGKARALRFTPPRLFSPYR